MTQTGGVHLTPPREQLQREWLVLHVRLKSYQRNEATDCSTLPDRLLDVSGMDTLFPVTARL